MITHPHSSRPPLIARRSHRRHGRRRTVKIHGEELRRPHIQLLRRAPCHNGLNSCRWTFYVYIWASGPRNPGYLAGHSFDSLLGHHLLHNHATNLAFYALFNEFNIHIQFYYAVRAIYISFVSIH